MKYNLYNTFIVFFILIFILSCVKISKKQKEEGSNLADKPNVLNYCLYKVFKRSGNINDTLPKQKEYLTIIGLRFITNVNSNCFVDSLYQDSAGEWRLLKRPYYVLRFHNDSSLIVISSPNGEAPTLKYKRYKFNSPECYNSL